MSEGGEFEQFLETARAEHASESIADHAERVQAALEGRVSWRRRVSAAIAAGLATMARPAAASSVSSSARWMKVIVIGIPILGLSLVSYSVATAPAPAPVRSAPVVVEPVPAPVAVTPSAPTIVGVVEPSDLPNAVPDVPSEAKITRRSKPEASARAGDGTLEAELALLSQVTAALQTNQPQRALALVDEHDRRFAGGLLVPEFAGQRVLALAALGRHGEACAQSKAFLSKYPKSPLAAEVRTACDPSSSR